ncbi:hypothetical protein NL108_017283, partial [Boleophthalmus pectinirostris]
LKVPPSCELVVGGEPQCWSEGSCLLFDDSFLHRAFHEGEKRKKSFQYVSMISKHNYLKKNVFIYEGNPEDGPRVVFMVDLWHPNVAAAERQALDYIFTPGRLEDREGK